MALELKPDPLLRPDVLKGIRIAISTSESSDLARLGLVETHFRLALAEIARSILVSSGKISFGGRLGPDGYTQMLMKELQRYSRRDKPLRICLAWQEHRKLTKAEFDKEIAELGLFGEIVCLDPAGKPIPFMDGRSETAHPITDEGVRQRALSGLRLYMAQHENGRVLIGGKRADFEGTLPGVLEEAITSLKYGQPLYLAGGFGGVTTDIAKIVGFASDDWLQTLPNAPASDKQLQAGFDEVAVFVKANGWPDNGLSGTENAQLAMTHRPSEIAALVSFGLGKRFGSAK